MPKTNIGRLQAKARARGLLRDGPNAANKAVPLVPPPGEDFAGRYDPGINMAQLTDAELAALISDATSLPPWLP